MKLPQKLFTIPIGFAVVVILGYLSRYLIDVGQWINPSAVGAAAWWAGLAFIAWCWIAILVIGFVSHKIGEIILRLLSKLLKETK